MAKIVNIPDADNVLRYAKKTHLIWKKADKSDQIEIAGCFPALFKLRNNPEFNKIKKGPEKSLSVNWIEYFKGDEEQKLQKTVEDFCTVRKIGGAGAFAKLNVHEFKKVCLTHSAKIRIIHDAKSSASNKSHSSITQLPQDNALLLDDLCEIASKALIPATRFKK